MHARMHYVCGPHSTVTCPTRCTIHADTGVSACPAASAQNRVSKGFIMGRLQFVLTNLNGKTSITTFVAPSLTASTTSSVLHMYQSFIAPPSLTPGQFSKFTGVVGPATTPFTYGASWASTVVTGTVKSGSSSYPVPSTEPSNGLYVAIHLTVGGSMCF